jgi:hypothetical protein
MIAAISEGGNSAGLMQYLVGQGRANEHENPHLVAGSDVIMRRWGAWDRLSAAQGFEIAKYVDQFMSETGVKSMGKRRVFNDETGEREVIEGPVANHVWHCSLSLSPREAAQGDERWQQIARDFADQMGFTGADGKAACRWVAVHHGSAKNGGDHIHIMVNVIREDGTKWNRYQDQPKAMRACNKLEHKYGLEVIEAREHARGARSDTAADLRASARRGQDRTDREILLPRVRAAATSATSERDFVLRLRELGVRARPRFARGRTDVVVGYSVALHKPKGQKAQWYAGGKIARDLTLNRLRTRWPDTPASAQHAVDTWRDAWKGQLPARETVASSAQLKARAVALEVYRTHLAGIDPTDATALADATTDVAGLLAAVAHGYEPGTPERAMMERASQAVGRHAQTKTRTLESNPTSDAIILAAGLISTAHMRPGFSSGVLVALSALRLADALADLYRQEGQTRTAQHLLDNTVQVFRRLHAGVPDLEAFAYRRAVSQATSGQIETTTAATAPAPSAAPAAPQQAGSQTSGQDDGGMSAEQRTRIQRMAALAQPAGSPASRPPAPATPRTPTKQAPSRKPAQVL